MSIREIRIEDYRYDLPENRIALYPLENRDQSKLLVFKKNQIDQKHFSDLPDLLPADSLIIWNNTKVIPARLVFHKSTGAPIEIFLLEPETPSIYTAMFDKTDSCVWNAIIGNQKKWKGKPLVRFAESPKGKVQLQAEYLDIHKKNKILLSWSPGSLTFSEIVDLFGKTPIPPYLKRDAVEKDKTSYQTVYANFDGSVAAPTAGLHFTEPLIDKLKQKNIRIDSVTLHVGAGTFIPVKAKTIDQHQMHAETVIIEKQTIQDLLNTPVLKLTVVGTTSLRSLESLYWLGNKIFRSPSIDENHLVVDQWEPYTGEKSISTKESLDAIIQYLDHKGLDHIQFNTQVIIVPGYQFRLVNRLITNFHQPSSTLLLLVSALVGDYWRDIYQYALHNDFRFLSYGDSSLLEMQSDKHD